MNDIVESFLLWRPFWYSVPSPGSRCRADGGFLLQKDFRLQLTFSACDHSTFNLICQDIHCKFRMASHCWPNNQKRSFNLYISRDTSCCSRQGSSGWSFPLTLHKCKTINYHILVSPSHKQKTELVEHKENLGFQSQSIFYVTESDHFFSSLPAKALEVMVWKKSMSPWIN